MRIRNLALIWALFFLSILCVIGIGSFPNDAHAQASMTGGGYTLNGGITVFDGDLSGGGYTLGAVGDPIAGPSTGGNYSLMPTPFENDDFTFVPPSSGGGGSVGGSTGGQTGAGYTLYPTSTASSSPYYPYYPWQPPAMEIPTDPTFDPNKPTTGVQWIDGGQGVDIDFDGQPDIFASSTFGGGEGSATSSGGTIDSGNGTSGAGAGAAVENPAPDSALLKLYNNDLTPLQMALAIMFILCIWFARIIRVAPQEHPAIGDASVSIGNLQTFRISRIPLAIFLDYIIAFHRTKGDELISHPSLRDFEMEKDAHFAAPGRHHTKASSLILMDGIIVPAVTIACIAWSWPMSWMLSLVFVALLAVRFFVGKKMLQG